MRSGHKPIGGENTCPCKNQRKVLHYVVPKSRHHPSIEEKQATLLVDPLALAWSTLLPRTVFFHSIKHTVAQKSKN